MFKFSFDKIKIPIVFALVLINSGYPLSLGFQSEIMVLSVLFIAIDLLISRRKIKLASNSTTLLVLILLQFFLTFIINFDIDGIKEYIRLFVVFLFSYYVYTSYKPEDIFQGFSNFMYFIAVTSLVFYIWILLFPSSAVRIQNGYETEYLTCFLSFVNVSSSQRNCGAFWEPSVFSAMCFIWGIIEIFIIRKLGQRKVRMLVLVATIITTFSTSGYVYLLFLLVAFLFRNTAKRISLLRLFLAVSLITVGLLVHYNFDNILLKLVEVNPVVFKKIIVNNTSVTDRTIGPLADMYVAIRNPLGMGLSDLTSTVQNVAYHVFGVPIHTRTSTITYYCAAFGPISGVVLVALLIRFVRRNIGSFSLALIVLIGLIFMSFSAPLHDSAIFIILLFIGAQEKKTERVFVDS